jgi:hypothetical protein
MRAVPREYKKSSSNTSKPWFAKTPVLDETAQFTPDYHRWGAGVRGRRVADPWPVTRQCRADERFRDGAHPSRIRGSRIPAISAPPGARAYQEDEACSACGEPNSAIHSTNISHWKQARRRPAQRASNRH